MLLGDLIRRLEAAPDQSAVVRWGFGNPHSSRGDYSELAFDPAENVTVASMLAHAKASLGATFEGWKGGDFTMHEYSACWIEKRGDWDQNGISDYLVNYWLAAADAVVTALSGRVVNRAGRYRSLAAPFDGEVAAALKEKFGRVAASETTEGAADGK